MEKTLEIIKHLNPEKHVLLVDADEVLLQFVSAIEKYCPTIGYEFKVDSFALTGNVYKINTETALSADEVKTLLDRFFDACVDAIPVVQGASVALAALSVHYQVVILSNVPKKYGTRRQKHLAKLGMDYPVIANKEGKGPTVKLVANQCRKQTAFIDDLPPHHASVAQHSPKTHRIHYIADERLAGFMPKAPDAHHRFDSWADITTHLTAMAHDHKVHKDEAKS